VIDIATRLHHDLPMAVCCLDEAGEWAPRLEAHGIAVRALGRGPGFRPALGRAIARIAANDEIDLIHTHHYSPFVYGALARLWAPRVALVFTEHGRLSDAPPSSKRRLANQLLSRVPHRVFAVSEDVKTHLVGEGFHPRSVGVIYNGVEAGLAAQPADRLRIRRQLGIVVGTVARLDPVKDLGTCISAIATMTTRARLVVIGDGPERISLEALAAERRIRDRVLFLGHRDDAREVLAGCDVYVNSSISEGVSLTILEAMAAGLPVVATRVGGTPEVVTTEAGVLVPSRDPAAMANALERLSADPARGRALGMAGRKRLEERFTIDRMVSEYSEVYRSLAASPRPQAPGLEP
jgi:glycosyltransferase involved in cell wall biosynthesis